VSPGTFDNVDIQDRRIILEGDLEAVDDDSTAGDITFSVDVEVSFDSVTEDTESDVEIFVRDSAGTRTAGSITLFINDQLEPPTDEGFLDDDEFESDDYLQSGGTFYQGQQLVANDAGTNAQYELYELDTSEDNNVGAFVRELNANRNGQIGVDTSTLEGRYIVLNNAGNTVSFGNSTTTRSPGNTSNGSFGAAAVGDGFTVEIQTLDAEFQQDNIPADGLVDYRVDSNREEYTAVLTPQNDNITAEELNDTLTRTGTEVVEFDADGDGTDEEHVRFDVTRQSSVLTFDFSEVSATGEIDVATTVVDTGVSDSDSLGVGTGAEADVRIIDIQTGDDRTQIRQDRGDFIRFGLELTNTDTATVQFGSEDLNYVANVTVEDTEEDDRVNLTVNTFYAGRDTNINDNIDEPFEFVDFDGDGDNIDDQPVFEVDNGGTILDIEVTEPDQVSDVSDIESDPSDGTFLTDVLEPANYPIEAYVGESTEGRADDNALAIINERPDPEASTRVAPGDTDPEEYENDTVRDNDQFDRDDALLVQEESGPRSQIAEGDNVVVRFEVSGIYGFFDGETSLLNPPSLGAGGEDGERARTLNARADRDIGLLVRQTPENRAERNPNQEAKVLFSSPGNAPISSDGSSGSDAEGPTRDADGDGSIDDNTNVGVYTNAFENEFYVVIGTSGDDIAEFEEVDQSEFTGVEAGDRFNATFEIDEDNGLLGADEEDETVFTEFEIVETELGIDTEETTVGGDQVQRVLIENTENANITGTSTLAPGTQVTLEVETDTFLLTEQVEVQDDGTFAGQFDLANVTANTNFTVSADASGVDTVTEDGIIRGPQASVSISDQTVQAGSSEQVITVDSVSLSRGGFVTIHDSTLLDGDAVGSVRGTSDFLAPGEYEDVEVTLGTPYESGGSDTIIAMPHLDTNGNEQYDFVISGGQDDAPYTTADGSPVVADAELTIEAEETTTEETTTSTPEPTTTSTPEPTTTSTPEPTTTTTSGQPGFTAIVALIALVAAALLAARRRS
jgi:PGF-CTERM protein